MKITNIYTILMITHSKSDFIQFTKQKIAKALEVDFSQIDEHTEFVALGLDSLDTLFLIQELEDYLKIEINPLVFWDYPNIQLLSDHLIGNDA